MLKAKRRLHLLLAAAVTVITANAPANAAIFQQVYSGTVTYGYDHTGFFGAGSSLAGLAFAATYLIDDSKGAYQKSSAPEYKYSSIYGGEIYNLSSPVSAKLTVGDKTILFNGINYSGSSIYNSHNSGNDILSTAIRDWKVGEDGKSYNYGFLYYSAPADYRTFNDENLATPAAFQPADGEGTYSKVDSTAGTQTYLLFKVTQFTSSAAAVPEPASWALMIGGFGIVGGTLRRRPRRIALMA